MPSTKKLNVAIVISGRGSNMRALLEHAESYKVVLVASNNPEAAGLEIAEEHGIETRVFARKNYESVAAQKSALFGLLAGSEIDLIALAGYMQIVPADVIASNPGKLINIHPSLLPSYPGLDTHRRALDAGEASHGCTVHLVDAGVDTGTKIAQARCPCAGAKDEHELAARVLQLEHRIYPWVVNAIGRGAIVLEGTRVAYSEAARLSALKNEFELFD